MVAQSRKTALRCIEKLFYGFIAKAGAGRGTAHEMSVCRIHVGQLSPHAAAGRLEASSAAVHENLY